MSSPRSSKFPDVTAVILAGGVARRMGGAQKAFLDLGGDAILDRQIAVLRPRFAEILVAVGLGGQDAEAATAFAARDLRPVVDRFTGSGPLAGLHAALLASRTAWVFAFACDMPFLDGDLIDRMVMMAVIEQEVDAFVPLRRGKAEALHALYRTTAADEAERCLQSGRRAMVDLLAGVRTKLLKERDLPGMTQSYTWVNLNTPDELEAAALALSRAGTGPKKE